MLESEQSKMLRKIENTRKRADMISEVRKNNEQRAQKLAEEKARQERDVQERQQKILKDRKQKKLLNDLYKETKLSLV
eukprot:CAMPEP_0170487800 /NCGR_PEP_ID=MMETSP0208-20121228/6531_1 /TAXON_ID=197538 /ORGANISM="Strombidium inclinatum, Strain S3" /LENGTH=77 /DNA_ID=CAMNT_0010762199 /DNA_START=977 /DNA_END=1210 /DNA_ORIENTATION=-